MGKTIKFQANDKFVEDLAELQRELGTASAAETLRRLVAREVVLERAKKRARVLRIQGDDPNGDEIEVIG